MAKSRWWNLWECGTSGNGGGGERGGGIHDTCGMAGVKNK
jgi:hypothetical protein